MRSLRPLGITLLVVSLLLGSCGPGDGQESATTPAGGPPAGTVGTIRLYSSVTQDTIDAVLGVFSDRHPGVAVELFRAPTGELTARIAAEQRAGGVRADVLWLTDPLSIQQYAAEGLLRRWTPAEAEAVPEAFRTDAFWGTRLLNMVIVHQEGLDPAPAAWTDLTDPAYQDRVAIPDPGFAGSAFGVLAYFALTEDFGFAYYRALRENGAVQVQAPGDVVSGVAEGQYAAGMSLDKVVRDAAQQGSPIVLAWPKPGAIAVYSPIAVVASTEQEAAAEALVDFVLSREAQEAIASTRWQPVRQDVEWAEGGPQVTIDWQEAFDRQEELLEEYRSIFGG